MIQRRGSLESVLTKFIQLQFTLKEPHHAFVRVFLAQLCGRATTQSSWVQEVQRAVDPPLRELFSSLQQRTLLRSDVDMATLLQTFKVMHLGLTVLWALEGPPWHNIDKAIRAQVRMYCSGAGVHR